MSDERDGTDTAGEGDVADESEDARGGRTAVVTQPKRPTGKRSRQQDVVDTDEDDEADSTAADASAAKNGSGTKNKKATKTGSWKDPSRNPIAYVYKYLTQVVAELRKVIWPNRNQMVTYTSVVLVFLVFMVALVGLSDLGLGRLVLLVFGSD